MSSKIFKAALLCALAFLPVSHLQAQGLLPLTVNPLGSFLVRDQTSITANDPGVNSSYSIVGGGNELWGNADKGIFGYIMATNDFDVRVRVESLEAVHRYAKTGLMIRENLTSTARMVSLFATPTGATQLPPDQPVGEDMVEFNFRRAAGDGANNINLGSPGYPNAWLRLARRGSVFYGLVSRDGVTWTQSGSVDTSTWPAGAFKSIAYLGLGSSSHDDTKLVKSELRNFGVVTTSGDVQILNQPVDNYGVADSSVSFTAGLNDPVDAKYQWYANGVLIPNGTNATYTTPRLSASNDATKYKVTVTGKNGSTVTSREALLTVVDVQAPEFPQLVLDFDDGAVPFGAEVYGTAEVDPASGFGGGGGLVLARQSNLQNGAFVVDDFTGGGVVDSFTVAFKLQIGPGSQKPADGFSFSFGPTIPNAVFPSPQQGVGPGLAVSFDIYDNGDSEAPAIDVFYGVDPGNVPTYLKGNILHKPMALSDLVTSRYVDVVIRMNPGGLLDLVYNGQVIAYHVPTGFIPVTGGKFGFGAYAGGTPGGTPYNAVEAVDNILIDAHTTGSEAYVSSISPLGNNVSATPLIQVVLADLATSVDRGSIQLSFNGAPVSANVSHDDELATTTVKYQVPSTLAAASVNNVKIVWADDAGAQHTNEANFTVGSYVTLPASLALPAGSGTAADSGFRVRVYQITGKLTESAANAESALLGEKGANMADLTITDETGYFSDPSITSTINYDVNAAPLGLSTFPGIPGITDSKENFAAEILTYVEFPQAGFYQMGVRSDDGFKLTTGDENTDPIVLGSFEGAREPSDSIFGFVVPQAGVYPMRLLYYQGTGGAMVRWFSVDPNGDQVLINDTASPTALKAFRSVSGATASVRIRVLRNQTGFTLSWDGGGTLESATDLKLKDWTPVVNGISPYPVVTATAGGNARFYRVKQ